VNVVLGPGNVSFSSRLPQPHCSTTLPGPRFLKDSTSEGRSRPTGAGGLNRTESYVGIGRHYGFLEVAACSGCTRRGLNNPPLQATSKRTSGCFIAILSSTLAGPVGDRLPCSQFCTVSALIPKIAATSSATDRACPWPARCRSSASRSLSLASHFPAHVEIALSSWHQFPF